MTVVTRSVLRLEGLVARYAQRTAIGPLSLELPRGEVVALVGPNGSGKSTLLRLLAMLQEPSEGRVLFDEVDLAGLERSARARAVAYLGPELRSDFPLLAIEAVALGRYAHAPLGLRRLSGEDARRVQGAMERCACWELRDRALNELSSGERQRVALARGVAQDAQVLLLDETLARMDLHHQARSGRLLLELAAEGKTVVLVSHDVALAAEWSQSMILLKAGALFAQGLTSSVFTAERMEELFPGAAFVEIPHPERKFPILVPRR